MKILYINHEFPPVGGGGATASKFMSQEFVKFGHSVTMLTCGFETLPEQETVEGINVIRVKCKRQYPDHSSFSEMFSFLVAAYRRLPEIMKTNGPFDVVLVFFGIPNGPLALHIKKKWKIPYLVLLGGGDIPGAQKRFAFLYRLLAPSLKSVWNNASYVVANSIGLQKRAEAFHSSGNFEVIPNGIIPSSTLSENNNTSSTKLRLVSAARILEGKGLQHVVEALPKIVEFTNRNVEFTILGDGPYRSAIELLADSLNVTSYVTITGMVNHDEVMKTLAEQDIFLLPSHSEGMPNSVLEAMSVGLPVIMTNCEGSDELIHDNGVKINLNSNLAEQIVDAVYDLYHNPDKRKKMGRTGAEMIYNDFTWKKQAEKFISLMEKSI